MTGITNRPDHVEDENQQRVEARKDQLPDVEQVGEGGEPVAKAYDDTLNHRGRVSETGAGRGTEHSGH